MRTTKGDIDESLLQKTTGVVEDDNERTIWTEYRLHDEIVRRDVHVTLKQPAVFAEADAASL